MAELNVERRALHALIRLYRLLERSLSDLSLADFRVLSAVAQGEELASRLASRLAVGKPAISASVDSLVRRGLLSRTPRDDDLRALSLAVTERGISLHAEAEQHIRALMTDVVDATDDPELSWRVLAEINDVIERKRQEKIRHADTMGHDRGEAR